MIIVGELINSSRKAISQAIQDQDVQAIQKVAKDQHDAGADYIDVNAGTFVGQESEYVNWLVEKVQEVVDGPCCIDSPDPEAIEKALAVHKGTPLINSISLEKERFQALLPIVTGHECKVVALCMGDSGMPETADDRFSIAQELVNKLVQKGVKLEDICVDPLVQPVSTKENYGQEFLKAIHMIITQIPGVHTMCGLSNISFGLPKRAVLNRTFMSMAIAQGLDGAIVNPLDKQMMAVITTSEALMGRDEYCMNYLNAYRAGVLD
ncbi:MAG: methyltetrahydrofolate cobalamin methyltransferase [Desulfovermiculus sp.]|nr:methyltetrahydrofolate cobalamin methyltransferase [Desulfovermiculus sp.]